MVPVIYRFDSFAFDSHAFTLSREGVAVHLQPKVALLLDYLLKNRHRLVSKEELVENLWGARAVSDTVLTGRIAALRKALGDSGAEHRFIRTYYGNGFQFVGTLKGSVEPLAVKENTQDAAGEIEPAAREKPSIAVLPFQVVGDAGTYALLAHAVPDEVISSLAALRWLMVIARGSSFRFQSHMQDLTEIRAALGVTYCVSGSIEPSGDRLAVSVELADTRNSAIIWTGRHECAIADARALRVEILGKVLELPPSGWSRFCFRIWTEGGMEWHGSTSRKRL
ncbi:winged helix-turn-helix domain-containing protein, partial [Novosphingobium marinum]|uniref:winged helix-turn-helix domain-containing protein n=1 Tax=Novosphingobium marinum TaxID=1514948 RepID=UPI0015CBD15B